MKRLFTILSLCLLLLTLTSCNPVRKYNYNRIQAGDINSGTLFEEVVKLLGEADEVKKLTPDIYHNSYYWFDKADSYEDAIKKVKEGKKIYYIGIVTNLSDSTYVYCVGKHDGYVTEDFVLGEINLYA